MRQKRKNTYNIATRNVQSMYEGKLNIVHKVMKGLDTDKALKDTFKVADKTIPRREREREREREKDPFGCPRTR